MELVDLFTIIGAVIVYFEVRFRLMSKCVDRIEIKVNDIHNKVFHGKRDKVR